MARNLIGLPRDYHHPSQFVGGSEARRGDGSNSIYAMHWDGTYRDRVRGSKIVPEYWWDSQSHMVTPARTFAKHLA